MHRNGLALLAAGVLALPLLNCSDSTTAPTVLREPLILHQVATTSDLLTFLQPASIGVDSARTLMSQECAQRGLALGRLLRTGGSFGADAFRPVKNPINTSCNCPSQPIGGAPAGYTCTLVQAVCDETGRSCAYQCNPIQNRV